MFNSHTFLRIKREHEARQFLTCADQGSGKTTFFRQLADHIEACGDTAVLIDAKLELLPLYLNPARGDQVLSPKDERCPFWHIGGEVTDYADAVSVTRAMYPSHPGNPHADFFDNQANRVGAHLLVHGNPPTQRKPTCEQYGHWLAHPEEIYRRIRGTIHESTLDKNAPPQRAGILATMNLIGDALRMMPPESDGRPRFTIRDWCQHRKGWLWLPNPPGIREALRPLQSMWADLLMLRLLAMGPRPDLPRVWLLYDEVDSLNTLPQLHVAVTEIRHTGNPIALGMQNMAQMEDRYGRKAETILSQAYTKLILATSHGQSAETLSKLIGEIEIRRYRETRSGSLFGTKDRNQYAGPEDVRKPLVMPSEISGLQDLEGYFGQRGKWVKIKLPLPAPRKQQAPAWIERQIPSDPACHATLPWDSLTAATEPPSGAAA